MVKLSRRDFIRLSALGLGSALLAACRVEDSVLVETGQPLIQTATLVPTNAPPPTPTPFAPTSTAEILSGMGFDAFKGKVTTYQDDRYLYIESDGMPAHQMMVGITSWQQQVPLPQFYTGSNAWQIPLHPVLAETPLSAADNLFRGAIAVAVNGVPIFNALNNRGEDAYLAGELDDWGGHAGRADDYHYHTAPIHLQEIVGVGFPIAFALDGFPIYGSLEPDGSPMTELDEFNGHFEASGSYHYHGTPTYPYINGGMRGVVNVRDGQIDPQPHTVPVRAFLQPLKGAVITDFQELGADSYSLEYTLNGQKGYVNYRIDGNTYIFEFLDGAGNQTIESYPAP